MLVLSRKYHEQIVIGPPGPDQIVVTVVRIKGGGVRTRRRSRPARQDSAGGSGGGRLAGDNRKF
jgi:hypothetical protein